MEGGTRCSGCGKANAAGAQFCSGCGKGLARPPGSPGMLSVGDGRTSDEDAVPEETAGRQACVDAGDQGQAGTQKPPKRSCTGEPAPKGNRRPTVAVHFDQNGKVTGVETKKETKRKTDAHLCPPVERLSYAVLCDTLPSRAYLAVLGSGEPPHGYALRHCFITLGRGPENQITIQDTKISRAHALFAFVGRELIVIDLASRHGTRVNGREISQATVHRGDVVEVGSTRLVFAAVPGGDMPWGYELCPFWSEASLGADQGTQKRPMGEVMETGDEEDAEMEPAARVVLTEPESARRGTSEGRSLLIGSHEVCHLRLDGADVAMFHAQVYWGADGVRVRDLGTTAGTLVNGEPIDDAVLLSEDELSVAGVTLKVEFFGDVPARGEHLARSHEMAGPLALTCVSGTCQGVSGALPPMTEPVIVGRDSDSHLCLDDARASGRHASLTVHDGVVEVEDLSSRNGIRVNDKKVAKAQLKPGDVLSVGKSELLLHYAR